MVRRVTKTDQDAIAEYVREEFSDRKESKFRKKHERVWKEVDRQVAMEPPHATPRSGDVEEDWHSAIQLGNLSDASEIMAGKAISLLFPNDRQWYQPHAELEQKEGEDSESFRLRQKVGDNVLRSLMSQQHGDFGLKDRLELAIKECLHHGSFVGVVDMMDIVRSFGEGRVERLNAPMVKVHSMWSCYPDPSPYVQGTELFYQGSMIIKSSIPKHKVPKNWKNRKKVIDEAGDDNDIEILTYYGDVFVDRASSRDIWLPNSKIILAGSEKDFAFYDENATPFVPIIYSGYERDDVRDPYFTSPIIKRSPVHKVETEVTNHYLDALAISNEPPVAWNSADPQLKQTNGPRIAPRERFATNSPEKNIRELRIGNPDSALQGIIMLNQHNEKGLDTDPRGGASPSVQLKATEVQKQEQRSDMRIVPFVSRLERLALKPLLYMQHSLNRKNLDNYPFYNNEIHTPDFLRASKGDLPKAVHFEVVGSRSILNEQHRIGKFVNAIQISSQIPQIAAETDWSMVREQLWMDTGIKDPERFGKSPDDALAVMEQQLTAQFQEQAQQMQEELAKLQQSEAEHAIQKAQWQAEKKSFQNEVQIVRAQQQLERQASKEFERLKEAESSIMEEQQQLQRERDRFEDERERLGWEKKAVTAELKLAGTQADHKIQKAEQNEQAEQESERRTSELFSEIESMRQADRRKAEIITGYFRSKGNDEAVEVAEQIQGIAGETSDVTTDED